MTSPGKWYTVEVHRVKTEIARVRLRIPDTVAEDDQEQYATDIVVDPDVSPLQFVGDDEWELDDEQYEVQAVDLDEDQS